MTDLKTTISQLKEDLELKCTKEEFLAICVKLRLEEQSRKYSDHFDYLLHNLEISQNSRDFEVLVRSLKVFSITMTKTYESLLKELKRLETFENKF